MKKNVYTSIVLSSLLGTLILFGAGCSKKTVVPPGSSGSLDTTMSSGKDISYPTAEGGYSEENLPIEGNLDDTAGGGSGGSLGAAGIDTQTDEYMRVHGRSSPNLYPIYFDFDQAGITADMADVLVRNTDYLNTIPGAQITIEGNCDERGTNEYNLALGERRSINAKQFLVDLGVEPERISTLSYGEERPLFTGQYEDDYSRNRRADFTAQ